MPRPTAVAMIDVQRPCVRETTRRALTAEPDQQQRASRTAEPDPGCAPTLRPTLAERTPASLRFSGSLPLVLLRPRHAILEVSRVPWLRTVDRWLSGRPPPTGHAEHVIVVANAPAITWARYVCRPTKRQNPSAIASLVVAQIHSALNRISVRHLTSMSRRPVCASPSFAEAGSSSAEPPPPPSDARAIGARHPVRG